MTILKEEFTNRLLKVLGKRRKHSWGSALGFTNNRIHRLFKETEPLPSSEELALIGSSENLDLNWLMYGTGQMYRVQNFLEAEELNAAVESSVSRESSKHYLVVCQSKCAFITLERTKLEYKTKLISIQELHCLVGPGSTHLQALLSNIQVTGVEFPTHRFEELEAGELGTYILFGDHRTQGYVGDLESKDIRWLLGNMPLAVEHSEINLVRLINCYKKIQSFGVSTSQSIDENKTAELTWIMYHAENTEQHPL
jgi:hypothetical protein